jgi:hypothetical protein
MRPLTSTAMIATMIIAACAAFTLAACGTTERTVVVRPEPGQTVIVTPAH